MEFLDVEESKKGDEVAESSVSYKEVGEGKRKQKRCALWKRDLSQGHRRARGDSFY